MTARSNRAMVILSVALVVGAVASLTARREAAVLGLNSVELSLLGVAAGSLVTRLAVA